MKVFRINVSMKQDDFNDIYNMLDSLGKYSVYNGNIILLCDKKLSFIKKKFQNENDIIIDEVFDINKSIENKSVADWVKIKLAEYSIKEANIEIQKRTNALFDILDEANKHIEREGLNSDGSKQENTKDTK